LELSEKVSFYDVPSPRDCPHGASQRLGGLLLTHAEIPDQIEEFPVFGAKLIGYLVKP
jgi:hypothetical protein